MTFTKEDKLKEIAREIALRRRTFPRWTAKGQMTQEEADYRIAIMLEIAKDYGGHGDDKPDSKVQCHCGWVGQQSELRDGAAVAYTKFCPQCGAVFRVVK